ncbi:MAG: hypothetical protein QOE94_2343, partial [Mycobacterium sp.]|nr:hypothetical protein [Mycobacterium sp.]
SAASVNLSRQPPSPSRRSRRAPERRVTRPFLHHRQPHVPPTCSPILLRLRSYSPTWSRPRGGCPASCSLGVGLQDYPRPAGSRSARIPYKNSSEIRPKPGRRAPQFRPARSSWRRQSWPLARKIWSPGPPRRPEARPPRSFWSPPYRDHPVPPPPDPAARRLVPRVPRRRVAPLTTE